MTICPVCGSREWIKRYTISRWGIVECVTCAFARIDPMPDKASRPDCYSEEKVIERNVKQKNFLQKLSRLLKRSFGRIWGRDKSGIFYDKLCKYLNARSKILDVGCGDGSFLKKAKNNFDCTGIEISDYLARLATKVDGVKVIAGDFQTADFKDDKYDGITLISILEHMGDPLQAIKKCFDLLGDRGLLLLKTVNYNCLNRIIRKEKWVGFRPPDHVVYFSPANLELLLKKAGFGKIKISAAPFNDNMYCEALK